MSNYDGYKEDLTKIRGIGPVTEKALNGYVGIWSYAALTAVSATELEKRFREHGRKLSRSEIEAWQLQAKELAESEEAQDVIESPRKGQWRPFATVVVEFQIEGEAEQQISFRTRMQYMEIDRNETWAGIEFSQVSEWLKNNVQVPVLSMAKKEEVPQLNVKLKPVVKTRRQIEQTAVVTPKAVHLRQLPAHNFIIDVHDVQRPFLGHVNHDKPLSLELDLNVEETGMTPTGQCYLHNLETLKTKVQDMAYEILTNGEQRQVLVLKDVMLEPGVYDVRVMLQGGEHQPLHYLALPKLHVI